MPAAVRSIEPNVHYAVEGHEFYGIALSEVLPYSVARTWHTQLGIFMRTAART